jgi:putative two-component system hydrogenase maturation factor HypX/HoxX
MSTGQCRRLRAAVAYARSRPTRVICLRGGRDFWSNGIHLNVIEAAPDPARESWRNIVAMDDLVLEILKARQLVVAGLRGNAGAGGCMLALAADYVFARSGVVLNPHYRTMGGLYGSEYWTFTLPRRVGAEVAAELVDRCQPIGTKGATEIGLIDGAFGVDVDGFERLLDEQVQVLAASPRQASLRAAKQWRRRADERARPLASYRAHELGRMSDNIFGPDPSYHEARRRFVRKSPSSSVSALQAIA